MKNFLLFQKKALLLESVNKTLKRYEYTIRIKVHQRPRMGTHRR